MRPLRRPSGSIRTRFSVAPEAVDALLREAARKTGLQARYESLGRTFTATSLQHAFDSPWRSRR